jgi:hypothetical protein
MRGVRIPDLVRGPHHCVGVATFAARRIFDLLKARSVAQGGSLSSGDLDRAEAQFFSGLLKAAGYFEKLDGLHMHGIGSTAPELLARKSILTTLLIACGHKSARAAFPQVVDIGERWLRELFEGIANYVRQSTCPDADQRLIQAYFKLAMTLGGRLRIADLLNDDATRQVLAECLAPLIVDGADNKLAQPLSDMVTAHIATVRGIAGANVVKITAGEMRQFLSFLRPELRIDLGLSATADDEQQSNQHAIGEGRAAVAPAGEIAMSNLILTTEHSKST